MRKPTDTKSKQKGYRLLFVSALAILGAYFLIRSFATPTNTFPPTLSAPGAIKTFPDTSNGIHLGIGFEDTLSNPALISGKVDYIWAASYPHGIGSSAALHSTHLDVYMKFDVDYATPSDITTSPDCSNLSDHRLVWFQTCHPSWVLYQCDGKTPAYYAYGTSHQDLNVPIDWSNPAVMAYQAQYAKALLSQGYDGISFDNLLFSNYLDACGVYKTATPQNPWAGWTQLGYGTKGAATPVLDSVMTKWLSYMHATLKATYPNKTITINSPPARDGITTIPNSRHYLQYIDGVFDEYGFTEYGNSRLTDAQWQQQVAGYDELNAAGKAIIDSDDVPAYPYESAQQDSEVNWVLANYLLVKGSHTYTYMAGSPNAPTCPSGQRCLVDLPEYHVSIGYPTSGHYASQGVYMRNYSGGLTVVNPSSTRSFVVRFGETYYDTYGNRLSSLTMAPATGIVLLHSPPPAPPPSG